MIENVQFKDFEDCLVICNLKDFKEAKTKVYSSDELVALLEY